MNNATAKIGVAGDLQPAKYQLCLVSHPLCSLIASNSLDYVVTTAPMLSDTCSWISHTWPGFLLASCLLFLRLLLASTTVSLQHTSEDIMMTVAACRCTPGH